MAYSSGTETSDGAATATLVGKIEDALTAHAAWEYVEEVTEGGYTTRVWKNKGTENDFGSDWYLALMRTSDTSDLMFKAAEDWDGSNAIRGCLNPGSESYVESTYRSRYGDTGYPWSDSKWNSYVNIATHTSSFSWIIHVNNKRLVVQTSISGSLQGIKYIGLFDKVEPFTSAAWNSYNFPLVLAPFDNTAYDTDGAGSSSRRPMSTDNTSDAYAINSYFATGSSIYFVNTFVGDVGTLIDHPYVGSRGYVFHTSGNTTNGNYRGVYNDLLFFKGAAPSPVGGDTISVSGDSWISLGRIGSYIVWVPND